MTAGLAQANVRTGFSRMMIPRHSPPHPSSTGSMTSSLVEAPSLVTEPDFQLLSTNYTTYSPTKVEQMFLFASKRGLPHNVLPIQLRPAILCHAVHFSVESLLLSVELFSHSRIVDELFYKTIARIITVRLKEMTISQICRLLRAFDSVDMGEYVILNDTLFARLSSIINRASVHQIVDILLSVSQSETKLLDRIKIAELCLNRYSLSLRSSPDTYRDQNDIKILESMYRLQMVHEGTLRKIMRRFAACYDSIPISDYAQTINYLVACGVDVRSFERQSGMMTEREGENSLPPSFTHYSAYGVLYPRLVVNSAVQESPETRNDRTSLVNQYKVRMGLTALGVLDPLELRLQLELLHVSDLRKIKSFLDPVDGVVEKSSMHVPHLKELTRQRIVGPFRVAELANQPVLKIHPSRSKKS